MAGDDARIASPQLGSVGAPDRHHDRFVDFLATGDGLDDLVAGVARDTVGDDGRTEAQREDDAENAHRDAVLRRSATPPPAAPRCDGFFDEDLAPVQPRADDPEPEPEPTDPTDPDDPEDGADDSDDPEDVGEDGDPAVPDPVPPPGSLWDATHSGQSSSYDPGPLIVDPTPDRPEPGRFEHWLRTQHRRWWNPLGRAQKIVAAAIVGVLAAWLTILAATHHPAAPSGQPAAAPIVDTPSQAPVTSRPLPPATVDAPGCPARSQPAANAFDNDPSTAWICVRAYNADLQTITIGYAKPVVVCSIFVIPGFEFVDNTGANLWNQHRIVTLMKWQIGGQTFIQHIDPNAHGGATLTLNACVATSIITGTVFKTVPPTPDEHNGPDTDVNSTIAIPTITVNGYVAGGPAPH